MEWIINQLRDHPELAIFLTLFAGFWLGRFKIGKFSLGTVTSVLLVGVLVGQLNISVDGPMKAVFFLLFLFAVGYKVGPQFFRGLKKDGLPQVGFAVLMCFVSLIAPWILAKIMGYHVGEAAGLLAGSQTISAVIGVASDTINQLSISDAQKATFINAIPVAYAVTYIFGTAGSAWILASLGPKMLGGLEKVKADCKELEAKMGTSEADEPGFYTALRPVVFRAYKIDNEWFGKGKTVSELENYLVENDKRLFVERVRQKGVIEEVCPDIHIDMAMPVGYASTELVHQFALLEPFGKDNPSPLFADRNLSISRMWLIGKNRNVLRMSVLSEYGQPVPVIFFGDVETLFAYFTEKFGQEEVENALHGRKNRILFSMVYTAKIDFYQGNENLQLEMKYYR